MHSQLKKYSLTLPLLILATGVFSQTFNIRFGRDESLGFAGICRSSTIYNDTIYTVFSDLRSSGGWNPVLYKIDLEGNRIDSLYVESELGQHIPGWADAVFVKDGGVYFSGYMLPYEDTASSMGFICKYHFNNTLDWIKYYGDSIQNHGFLQAKPTSDGGIIAIGSAALSPSSPKFYVVKTDAYGNIEWEKFLGVDDKFRNGGWVTELENGNFLASGSEDRTEYNPCGIIYKLSANGTLLQTKKYPFWGLVDNQGVEAPTELSNGEIVFSTAKYDAVISNDLARHGQIVKINSATLDTVWTCRLTETLSSSSSQVIKQLEDGNLVSVGTMDWGYIDEPWSLGTISKVDLDGNLLWHRRHYFAEHGDNLLFDLDLLPNGGFLCTGYTFLMANSGDPVTAKEAWLLALDEEGCLVPDCENLIYSVSEEEPLAFSVYPNPVAQDLNIALAHNKGNAEVLIQIHDLQGRLITSKNININEGTITYDASFLTPGHYILSLTVDGFTKSMTIVKM
jgi:hypothetical protein